MWTEELIQARFVEAADTASRLPHAGHSTKSGFWPAFVHSFEDMNGWGTQRLAEERALRLKRMPPSAAAISRHDEVSAWASEHIEERLRHYVWAWALCRAAERSFSEHCHKKGWVRLTAYRRRDKAITQVLAALDKSMALVRYPDDKWMLQDEQREVCKSLELHDAPANQPTPTAIIFPGQKPADTLTTPEAVKGFEKHLLKVNRARRAEQARIAERKKRKLLGMDEAA